MEGKLNPNLVFLSLLALVMLAALFIGERMFPKDGEFFQVISMAFGSFITLLGQAIRTLLHLPDNGHPPTPPNQSSPQSGQGE